MEKRFCIFAVTAVSLIASAIVFAEVTQLQSSPAPAPATTTSTVAVEHPAFQTSQWTSKNLNDPITIANGTGVPIIANITVNNPGSNIAGVKPAGINIKNCGESTHVDAGSSIICSSSDATNPITFNSDSGTDSASGTYTVKQK